MMSLILELFKNSPVKSISITTLLFLAIFGVSIVKAFDYRYMQLAAGEQIQQTLDHDKRERLELEIFILKLKAEGATQEQIDAALKERYEKMLEDLKSGK